MKNAFFSIILDALYPKDCACFLCNREATLSGNGLCEKCLSQLRYCPSITPPEGIDGISAAYIFEGPVRSGILSLKYSGKTYLAAFFADSISIPAAPVDCIIPVPLHRSRLISRGYNQSALIADALCSRTSLPVKEDLLIRSRKTHIQQGLSRKKRRSNLKKAFTVSGDVQGLSILLVDDVITTGSTLSACAQALKKAGAAHVYAVCACAAQTHG